MKNSKIKLIKTYSYYVNEANTNPEYGTTQVLSSNLSFGNPNNDSTPT